MKLHSNLLITQQFDLNQVVIGSCGSGGHVDCDGHTHQLLCCDLDNFVYSDCLEFQGDYGIHLSCPELTKDKDTMVEASCGSEGGRDCHSESAHTVRSRKKLFVRGHILIELSFSPPKSSLSFFLS